MVQKNTLTLATTLGGSPVTRRGSRMIDSNSYCVIEGLVLTPELLLYFKTTEAGCTRCVLNLQSCITEASLYRTLETGGRLQLGAADS